MKINNFRPGYKKIRIDDETSGHGYIVAENLLPLTENELHDLITKEKRMTYVKGEKWGIPFSLFAVIE